VPSLWTLGLNDNRANPRQPLDPSLVAFLEIAGSWIVQKDMSGFPAPSITPVPDGA